MSYALFWVISKFTRHLGQRYRGDHHPRTRPNSLQTCPTSPRMATLSIPRLDVLGYSSSLTRDIGPSPSSRTVGIQDKIGPHRQFYPFLFTLWLIEIKLKYNNYNYKLTIQIIIVSKKKKSIFVLYMSFRKCYWFFHDL